MRVQKTLFGVGGVQGLDGEAHRRRKQLFMSMMTSWSIRELADLVAAEWRASLDRWGRVDAVVLQDEVGRILCRAVCTWAGVPLQDADVRRAPTSCTR